MMRQRIRGDNNNDISMYTIESRIMKKRRDDEATRSPPPEKLGARTDSESFSFKNLSDPFFVSKEKDTSTLTRMDRKIYYSAQGIGCAMFEANNSI